MNHKGFKISKNRFVLFLIWPFAVLLNSFKRITLLQTKTIFWLFCIYFGFNFIINFEGGADSTRYAAYLQIMYAQSNSFETLFSQFYNSDNGYIDIYQPLATWLVSLFTNDYRFLFALFATVFGYFYVQNIWIIITRLNRKIDVFLALFIMYLFLINPIWNINGVRMWTGAHVFLYGILKYFIENNKKGVYWIITSFFFHFSFSFAILFSIIYYFTPKNTTLLIVFYIVTAFVNEVDFGLVRSSLSFLPDVFQFKVESYTNEAYVEVIEGKFEMLAWHVKFVSLFSKYIGYAIVVFLFSIRKTIKHYGANIYSLMNFSFFFGGAAQLAALILSGGRFLVVSNFLFFALFVLILGNIPRTRHLKILLNIIAPFLVFVILFKLRVGFEYIGFITILSNPIISIFFHDQTPLIEFVKNVF